MDHPIPKERKTVQQPSAPVPKPRTMLPRDSDSSYENHNLKILNTAHMSVFSENENSTADENVYEHMHNIPLNRNQKPECLNIPVKSNVRTTNPFVKVDNQNRISSDYNIATYKSQKYKENRFEEFFRNALDVNDASFVKPSNVNNNKPNETPINETDNAYALLEQPYEYVSEAFTDQSAFASSVNYRVNPMKSSKIQNTSQSIILEFDPLAAYGNTGIESEKKSETKNYLDDFLMDLSDLHLNQEVDSENNHEIYSVPAKFPRKYDGPQISVDSSVKEANIPEIPKKASNSQWFNIDMIENMENADHNEPEGVKRHKSMSKKFSNMLKIIPSTYRPKSSLQLAENDNKLKKPPLAKYKIVHYGSLVRLLSSPLEELLKNHHLRYCVLENSILTCFNDKTKGSIRETYDFNNFMSVQPIKSDQCQYLYFQVAFSGPSLFVNVRNIVTFGCETIKEREKWLMNIVLMSSGIFPMDLLSDYGKFGWTFIKESVTQNWQSGWLLIKDRRIYFHTHNNVESKNDKIEYYMKDLRKSKCVDLQKNTNETENDGPTIIVDFQGSTLYLKMGSPMETKSWKNIIELSSCDNGLTLQSQQLTKDDIPTVVQKCINFISCHGSLTEGIYRRNGRTSAINKLLEAFNKNAWSLHLLQNNHCVYDVATALKKYFQSLNDALIPSIYIADLCLIGKLNDKDRKILKYQEIIAKFNSVHKNTLKVLLGHLYYLSMFSDKNLMSIMNLASIWAPTMIKSKTEDKFSMEEQFMVIVDLITFYVEVFMPSEAEIQREKSILNVIQKFSDVRLPVHPSGDFKIWIYIGSIHNDALVNLTIAPTMTCKDVCQALSPKINLPIHELCLEEYVYDKTLRRPLHHSEIVMDIISNWSGWESCYRKENTLLLCVNTVFTDVNPILLHVVEQGSFTREWKYCDDRSKSFKVHTIMISTTHLVCFKDRTAIMVHDKWNLKDIRWYIGHETKRNPNTNWAITFINLKPVHARAKPKPWFGHTIAGDDREDFKMLLAFLFKFDFPKGLLSDPALIDPNYLV